VIVIVKSFDNWSSNLIFFPSNGSSIIWPLTSFHLIGWYLWRGVVVFSIVMWVFVTKFHIACIYFPGWGISWDCDPDSFVVSMPVITSLFVSWSTECFFVRRFCGFVCNYSIKNIDYKMQQFFWHFLFHCKSYLLKGFA